MATYLWTNDPRDNPDTFPVEGIGFHWNALCIQGEPKLVKRPNERAWQFDLFIKSIRVPDQGVRYPTQGIILITHVCRDDETIELTVNGRDRDLSLKQLELAYDYVASVLDGKIQCDVPVSEIRVKVERKVKSKKESKSKGKKGDKEDFVSVEPAYLVGYD